MGRSSFHLAFLIASFLILYSSHGCGRRLLKSYEDEEYATAHSEGNGRDGFRKMIDLDYDYPGPNDNPKYGFLVSPPPPPLAPAPTP